MTLEPTRINLARWRAGLSKLELATRLEATSRTVANYETHGAPDRAAADLARAIGCTVAYLRLPATRPVEGERVFFRARRRSTAAQKHAATAAGHEGIEFYAVVTDHFKLPYLTLPEFDSMAPADAAQQLRAEWNLGIDPLPNLVHLAESHGIRVMSLPAGAVEVDAFSVWEGNRPYVFLSTIKTAERSRFDLAHEIGHLVLHAGLDDSAASERNAEKEADAFASAFLLPRILLRSKVGREPSVEAVLKFKARFGVSAMAMAYALHQADLTSDWSYRQMCVELTKRGFRYGEPEGMQRELSRVFGVVLAGLRDRYGWETEDIADRLGVTAAELHGLTFGQAIASVSSEPGVRGGQPSQVPRLSLVD